MTPLPSLFDKMIEATRRIKRSTSVQPGSKVGDDPFALPSIPEVSEGASSDPIEVHSVQQPSDVSAEAGDEPEPVVHQAPATDHMDFEDTPIVSPEPVDPAPAPAPVVPPPPPASVPPPIHEEDFTSLPQSNTLCTHLGPPVAPYAHLLDSHMHERSHYYSGPPQTANPSSYPS